MLAVHSPVKYTHVHSCILFSISVIFIYTGLKDNKEKISKCSEENVNCHLYFPVHKSLHKSTLKSQKSHSRKLKKKNLYCHFLIIFRLYFIGYSQIFFLRMLSSFFLIMFSRQNLRSIISLEKNLVKISDSIIKN